jgi:hypothetical protein
MKTFSLHFIFFWLLMFLVSPNKVFTQDLPEDFVQRVRAEYNSIAEEVVDGELQQSFSEYLEKRIVSYRNRQDFYKTLPGGTDIDDLCANGTFENGEINLSDWNFYWEGDQGAFSGTNRVNTGSFNSGGPHANQVHHQVVNPGLDPFFASLDQVWIFPVSNNHALRLGNANPRWGLESVAKKIVVTPATAALSFSYAIVTDNPAGHGSALPFFEVNIIDAANNAVNYNNLINLGNSSNRISSDNPLLIPNDPNASRRWKDWTCVTADLSSLMGDTVIVEFVNRDCWAGAHWAYSYIDNLCIGCEGAPGDEGAIKINQTQSDTCGIPGQICIDYTLPNGNSPALDLELEIIQNGVTVNTLSSPTLVSGSTYCFNLTTADTVGLDGSLAGFDYKITGYPSLGGFNLTPQIIGSSAAGYLPGANNDYILDCPTICGEIIRDTLTYSCDNPQSIPYTSHVLNSSGLPVTSVLITDVSPIGTTISPSAFNVFFTPIPDGGIYGPLTTNINLLNPVTEPTEVCFTVRYISEGTVCCSYQHCITILPPDPCNQVDVRVISSSNDGSTDDCCYELSLTNDFCPDYFTSIMTEVITPGVVFGGVSGGNTWMLMQSANGQFINWRPQGGGRIPTGSLGDMQFCLDSINSISQVPQEVMVHWMRGDEIVCSDTLQFNCNPCAFLDITEVTCNDDGTFTFDYTIQNTSGQNVNYFYFEVHDSTVVFNPLIVNQTISAGGFFSGSVTVSSNSNWIPGDQIPFKLVLFGDDDWCCHMGGLSVTVPDCEKGCDCGDQEEWQKLFDQGYNARVDCENGVISFTTLLSECDSVIFNIVDAASQQLVATGSGAGDQVINLPILPNGGYIVEFIAVRYDANGEPCFRARERFDLKVDCPEEDCCGDQDLFTAAIQAGYDIDFICEGINGPVVTFTPLAASACDQIEWRILDAAGNVLASSTSSGMDPISFNVSDIGNFILETRWERFNENGESCFGFIRRQQTIINPCAQNAGPIVVSLAVKDNKSVTVRWEVPAEASYQEYVLVREDSEDAQVIAKVPAKAGQISYQYDDNAPLPGKNQYVVYGLILEAEAGRSAPRAVKIATQARPEVKLMPNPTVQYASVTMSTAGSYQLLVRDEFGRIYQRHQVNLPAEVPYELDVSTYPAGILLVQLVSEEGEVYTQRLVKLAQ